MEFSEETLAQSVSASAPPDKVNISIVVTDYSTERSARIANAVTASFTKAEHEITSPSQGESQVAVIAGYGYGYARRGRARYGSAAFGDQPVVQSRGEEFSLAESGRAASTPIA